MRVDRVTFFRNPYIARVQQGGVGLQSPNTRTLVLQRLSLASTCSPSRMPSHALGFGCARTFTPPRACRGRATQVLCGVGDGLAGPAFAERILEGQLLGMETVCDCATNDRGSARCGLFGAFGGDYLLRLFCPQLHHGDDRHSCCSTYVRLLFIFFLICIASIS